MRQNLRVVLFLLGAAGTIFYIFPEPESAEVVTEERAEGVELCEDVYYTGF